MADDDKPIAEDTLRTWQAPEPPADFADRVMSARRASAPAPAPAPPSPARRRSSRARVFALIAAATAAAVIAAVALRPRAGRASSGERTAATRESISLGSRGIAVAEPGTQLSWTVSAGGVARIEQPTGSVFYRVDRGGPFVVHTPGGDVIVHGTCFSVEVRDMKPARSALIGAGAGALIAATVVVTVYEGRVGVANPRGQTTLAPGEQATLTQGSAPATTSAPVPGPGPDPAPVQTPPPPAPTATRDDLLARDEAQRSRIVALTQQVRELEIARDLAQSANRKGGSGASPFFAPSKDELVALAGGCRLKWDLPPIGLEPELLGPKQAARWGLGDDQRAAVNQVITDFNSDMVAKLRALYVEVTGDAAGADNLTPRALGEDIVAKSSPDELQLVFQRLSAERAGLAAAPAPAALAKASPLERLMRLETGAGDAFEAAVGRVVGPERAHAARAANDGWGNRNESSRGCPDAK